MPIKIIKHGSHSYPYCQSVGFAAQFAIPFAKYFCIGEGYDVGCSKLEWCLPGAIPIDPVIDSRYHALNFPKVPVDFIFSSHCLEHIPEWTKALNYWVSSLKKGGVLFLYLPHPSQTYWASWVNTKHIHLLHQEDLVRYLHDHNFKNIFSGNRDLNHSYTIVGEKNE